MKHFLLFIIVAAGVCIEAAPTSKPATVDVIVDKAANKSCENVTEADLIKDKPITNELIDLVAGELSAVEVMNELQSRNQRLTVNRMFSVRSWRGVSNRVNLPFVKDYVADKIDSFHQLDLGITFKLLGKIGHVLRVAYAGCDRFKCQNGVAKLMEEYQDLLTSTKRLSQVLVNKCIKALWFHKFAYDFIRRNRKTSLKQFKRTIPMANTIKDNSTIVVGETEKIRVASKKVAKQARDELVLSNKKHEEFKTEMKQLEEDQIKYREEANSFKKGVEDMRDLIKKVEIEEAKVETKQELVRKMSVIGPKCEKINSTSFKEICNDVSIFIFYSSKDCKLHEGIKNKIECRDQLSKDLIEDRRKQREYLAQLKAKLFDQRIKNEEKKLELQKLVRKQFKMLQITGQRLKNLQGQKLEKNQFLERATISLTLATNSMNIVQTQLQKMVDFWDNIVKHTKQIVDEASENRQETDYKEQILGSGFSWIALAEVLRIAAMEMRKTSYAMDDSFMKLARENEIERLINSEGQEIIDETYNLSQRYGERMNKQKEKIAELLCKKRMQQKKDEKDVNIDVDMNIDIDMGMGGDDDFSI